MSSEHQHSHHHHHHHHHAIEPGNERKLYLATTITLLFALIEAIAGWQSGSLALMSDAGHMLSDAGALGLAAVAAWLGRKPPTSTHTYGLMRAEILGALLNGIVMLFIVTEIVSASFERFQHPGEVDASVVIVVGIIGLVVNIAVAYVLSHAEENLNTRAALIHVLGDLLGSVAAVTSGVVIYYSGWSLIDPILSIFICVLILVSTLRLLKEVMRVIMEGVPSHLDLEKVGMAMAGVNHVKSVHDLHIWTLASGKIALSAHIVLIDMRHWTDILADCQHLLDEKFAIHHVTLQPELMPAEVIAKFMERK